MKQAVVSFFRYRVLWFLIFDESLHAFLTSYETLLLQMKYFQLKD